MGRRGYSLWIVIGVFASKSLSGALAGNSTSCSPYRSNCECTTDLRTLYSDKAWHGAGGVPG